MPFFSIVTCTLNSMTTVEACISSVESQACGDYEHVFVDGGSSDGTLEIIHSYASRYSGRVCIHHLEPSGVTSAMNKGVAVSNGRVVLHLHGDDRLAGPNVLSSVKRLFETTSADVVTGNCRLEGNPAIKQTWPENPLARRLYKALMPFLMFHLNPIAHPSTYVSRAVFERHGGFNEDYQVVMDYDFWFRILPWERWAKTDEILSVYRFHSDTISSRQMELGLREIDGIHANYRLKYPLRYLLYAGLLRPLLLAGKALRTTKNLTGQRPSPQTLRCEHN